MRLDRYRIIWRYIYILYIYNYISNTRSRETVNPMMIVWVSECERMCIIYMIRTSVHYLFQTRSALPPPPPPQGVQNEIITYTGITVVLFIRLSSWSRCTRYIVQEPAIPVTNNKMYCNRYYNYLMCMNMACRNTSESNKFHWSHSVYGQLIFPFAGIGGGAEGIILHFFCCCYWRHLTWSIGMSYVYT